MKFEEFVINSTKREYWIYNKTPLRHSIMGKLYIGNYKVK